MIDHIPVRVPYLQDQAIQSRTVRLCIAWSCKYGIALFCTVFELVTLNNIMTLKSRLAVAQRH